MADEPQVKVRHKGSCFGKLIVLRNARLGYQAGGYAFVIGAAEAQDSRTTILTVLKRI